MTSMTTAARTHGELAIERAFDLDALLTDQQREWRDRARSVAREIIEPIIRESYESATVRTDLLPALAEAGLLGMHISGYGCAGADPISYGLACMEIEAVDSSWRTIVSVQGSLAMSSIAKFGSEEQKSQWLPRMARGEAIGAFALTEPSSGSDPARMTTRAMRDGDDWVITGAKRWIGLANLAEVIVVYAATDDGIRGFLVPRSTPGMVATPIAGKQAMRASVQCHIDFDGVRIPESLRLPDAIGLSAPFACLNEARFGIAWGVTGAARECLAVAVDYVNDRSSFGTTLSSKQLVQEKLAESFVAYERSVLLALHVGRVKAAGQLTPTQISVAKLNNVRDAIHAAHLSRQVLGGNGITDEFPVMRHLANLEGVRTYECTDDIHALVIGRALTGRAAF